MTERINSSAASFESDSFSPAGDWSVQADIPDTSKAYVEAQVRVDASADWVPAGAISRLTNPPVLTFTKVPFARVILYGNTDLQLIKAWSGE